MPRSARIAPGGMLFHVINRGVGKQQLFFDEEDYRMFRKAIAETLARYPLRICGYCLMPNHWHFVMWPERDGDLSAFMQRLTVTHSARWKRRKQEVGYGHLYQGRYKSFPIQSDGHFLQVARYVERNALRAGLVRRAEDWPWSSLWVRVYGSASHRGVLCGWPVTRPNGWTEYVNQSETRDMLSTLRRSVNRGTPFGSSGWVKETATRLGLEFTTRQRGRPKAK